MWWSCSWNSAEAEWEPAGKQNYQLLFLRLQLMVHQRLQVPLSAPVGPHTRPSPAAYYGQWRLSLQTGPKSPKLGQGFLWAISLLKMLFLCALLILITAWKRSERWNSLGSVAMMHWWKSSISSLSACSNTTLNIWDAHTEMSKPKTPCSFGCTISSHRKIWGVIFWIIVDTFTQNIFSISTKIWNKSCVSFNDFGWITMQQMIELTFFQ